MHDIRVCWSIDLDQFNSIPAAFVHDRDDETTFDSRRYSGDTALHVWIVQGECK